ncbi:hypothetical protein NUSPORA_02153 [Nucleospora cyclopteri]
MLTHTRKKLKKLHQVGFIPGIEDLLAVAYLIEILQIRIGDGKETWLAFLDLRKVYDLVPQDLLFNKLRSKGIGENFVKVIENIYRNNKSEVRIGKSVSETFRIQKGVRQGYPFSPILFDIFIDDMLEGMTSINIPGIKKNNFCGILFAGDTMLISESREELENKISQVKEWLNNNEMELNASKSGIMKFLRNERSEMPVYFAENIPAVNKYVYLGIEVNDQLNEKMMAEFRIQKGWRTLEVIK